MCCVLRSDGLRATSNNPLNPIAQQKQGFKGCRSQVPYDRLTYDIIKLARIDSVFAADE